MTRAALRGILLALLAALVAGFVAGTVIRMRFERPIRYLGALDGPRAKPAGPAIRSDEEPSRDDSRIALLVPVAGRPLDVAAAGAAVLHPRHHEEQVG
jgi:hypothetical protein